MHVASSRSVALRSSRRRRRARRIRRHAQTPGVREVSASARSVIPLQTRLRYTTMIVLPEGEEILDVICGDKDFWVISADAQHGAREAGEGGRRHEPESRDRQRAVYSFLLNEKRRHRRPRPQGLRERRPERAHRRSRSTTAPPRSSDLQARTDTKRTRPPRRPSSGARPRRIAAQQAAVSRRSCSSSTATPKYEKPFLVRAIWHDGQFTYIKTDAHGTAGAVRAEGRQAGARELPGARRHVRRAEGARPRLPGARRSSASRSRSKDGSHGGRPRSPRHAARHRPSARSRGRAAARHADLAHGRPGRRHAGHHLRRRPARRRPSPRRRLAAAPPAAPNTDRVRDYQDRLRALEAQAVQEEQAAAARRAGASAGRRRTAEARESRRRRPDRRREEAARTTRASSPATSSSAAVPRTSGPTSASRAGGAAPSRPISEPARAVDRRDRRRRRSRDGTRAGAVAASDGATRQPAPPQPAPHASRRRLPATRPAASRRTTPIRSSDAGPLHRVLEGTLIDTVLTNRLDGSAAAPVNCLVTNPLYSHSGQRRC